LITVSDAFKSAIYSTSRKTYAKVVFDILDVDANTDATATVTSESTISQKTQIFNQVREMSGKYATLENDYWLLDGSFSLPPKNTETTYEAGWWSSALSGVDGTFSTPQVVTVTFTKDHSSIGLTITFDTLTNEYAKDFTIQIYDSSDVLMYTDAVTNNTLSQYTIEHNTTNYRKVIITITKWVTAYRRARITEIDFGIVEEYTGNELTKVDVLEEIDTMNNVVTSNELRFTIDNQDLRFNILNPTGIYPYLQRKQKIHPYIGVERADLITEYVPMGIYYLNEWKSDEGTLTASFTARDILDILAQGEFVGATYTGKTLKYIAEAILVAGGVTSYVVDTALASVTVTATIAKMTYREALQLVGIAGKAVVYSDRYGVVQMKQLSVVASTEVIDFDNVYNAPTIKLDKLINTIYIVKADTTTYTYTDPAKLSTDPILSVKVENSLITTDAHALSVSIWLLGEYNKRYLSEINWRQNPMLECGDIVLVENEFGVDKEMRITKNEFSFAGYLSGRTDGRGGA
jgi:hypothetical protein